MILLDGFRLTLCAIYTTRSKGIEFISKGTWKKNKVHVKRLNYESVLNDLDSRVSFITELRLHSLLHHNNLVKVCVLFILL